MKELAKKFKVLVENTEKYITFSVSFKVELENGKTSKNKMKHIDGFGFMSRSLSILADNLTDGLDNDQG